jgi:hypothetical protein
VVISVMLKETLGCPLSDVAFNEVKPMIIAYLFIIYKYVGSAVLNTKDVLAVHRPLSVTLI